MTETHAKWLTFIPRTEKLWQSVIENKKLNQENNSRTQNPKIQKVRQHLRSFVPAIEPLPPQPLLSKREIVCRTKVTAAENAA